METYYIIRVKDGSETYYAEYAVAYELTTCFGDAHMYKVQSIAEAVGKLYKARGYEVDICKLKFVGSYEV